MNSQLNPQAVVPIFFTISLQIVSSTTYFKTAQIRDDQFVDSPCKYFNPKSVRVSKGVPQKSHKIFSDNQYIRFHNFNSLTLLCYKFRLNYQLKILMWFMQLAVRQLYSFIPARYGSNMIKIVHFSQINMFKISSKS